VRNEISCLKKLKPHKNIIGFVHSKEFSNYIILAIEYASGGTLQDLIKASKKGTKKLTPENCRCIMKSILKGLQHIQIEMDLVHRDLKPSNIVVQKI